MQKHQTVTVCAHLAVLILSGLHRTAHLHSAEVHAEGLLEERDIVAAMETAQTLKFGLLQQCTQQQGLTTISLEEQKILLSLDRLNHQLHCEQFVKALSIMSELFK